MADEEAVDEDDADADEEEEVDTVKSFDWVGDNLEDNTVLPVCIIVALGKRNALDCCCG